MKLNTKIIADKAGVSTATVSRVLNDYEGVREITRKRVLRVINKYNYEINAVAKSLKQKKTMTIGIIIGHILSQFNSIIAGSVEDVSSRYGYNTMLCISNDDPEKELKYLKVLRSNRVEGIILVPTGKNADYVNNLLKAGTKIVLLDKIIKGVDCDSVVVDNMNGAYNGVRHLVEQGFRRIGIIDGSIERITGYDRLRGYKKALREKNIKINEDFIKIGDFKKESGYRMTGEILKNQPDALFVANLDMLLGSVLMLKEKNIRIPEDIAIVGFDDSEWALLMNPPITVVQQPVRSIAATGTEILMKKLINKSVDKPKIHTLKTNLVIRGSSIKK